MKVVLVFLQLVLSCDGFMGNMSGYGSGKRIIRGYGSGKIIISSWEQVLKKVTIYF